MQCFYGPVGSDSNYEQRRGREVLHREANNELHNSDESNFINVANVKSIKRSLAVMAFLTNNMSSNFKQIRANLPNRYSALC